MELSTLVTLFHPSTPAATAFWSETQLGNSKIHYLFKKFAGQNYSVAYIFLCVDEKTFFISHGPFQRNFGAAKLIAETIFEETLLRFVFFLELIWNPYLNKLYVIFLLLYRFYKF